MAIIGNVHTDIGIVKKVNQDAACLKVKPSPIGDIALCAVCDGMGGLTQGEVASSVVIQAFSEWFDSVLPTLIAQDYTHEMILSSLHELVTSQNEDLYNYSYNRDIKMGTTLSALIVIDQNYYIVHVGDSRVYALGKDIRQLTEDHTFVNQEIKSGRLTALEAKKHPKGHVLTQCIGVLREISPQLLQGLFSQDETFLICSDGFRHHLSDEELLMRFQPQHLMDVKTIKMSQYLATETLKERNEKDNITVAIIKNNNNFDTSVMPLNIVMIQSTLRL